MSAIQKDLLKHTESSHAEYEDLLRGLNSIQTRASEINERVLGSGGFVSLTQTYTYTHTHNTPEYRKENKSPTTRLSRSKAKSREHSRYGPPFRHARSLSLWVEGDAACDSTYDIVFDPDRHHSSNRIVDYFENPF